MGFSLLTPWLLRCTSMYQILQNAFMSMRHHTSSAVSDWKQLAPEGSSKPMPSMTDSGVAAAGAPLEEATHSVSEPHWPSSRARRGHAGENQAAF